MTITCGTYLPASASTSRDKLSNDGPDLLQLQAEAAQQEAARAREQLRHRVGREQARPPRYPPVRPRHGQATEWGGVGPEERKKMAMARWDRQLGVRRRVYRQNLYCKHVGSNRTSKLAAPPSAAEIASTPVLQSTLLQFIRRDLLAFPMANLDVEFLATYMLTVLKSLHAKSEEAVRLLSDFLGFAGAEHFCHEVYTFLRFIVRGAGVLRDKVLAFDHWAQYDWPENRPRGRRAVEMAARKQGGAREGGMSDRPAREPDGRRGVQREERQEPAPEDGAAQRDVDSSMTPSREEVISRREHWLARVQQARECAEGMRESNAASSAVDEDDQHNAKRSRLTVLAHERTRLLLQEQSSIKNVGLQIAGRAKLHSATPTSLLDGKREAGPEDGATTEK